MPAIARQYCDAGIVGVDFISADERERLYSDGANRVIRHKLIRSLPLSAGHNIGYRGHSLL